ncbi:hypothetical protein IAT40_004070 [Kwoniella sp. CBS 6097]
MNDDARPSAHSSSQSGLPNEHAMANRTNEAGDRPTSEHPGTSDQNATEVEDARSPAASHSAGTTTSEVCSTAAPESA